MNGAYQMFYVLIVYVFSAHTFGIDHPRSSVDTHPGDHTATLSVVSIHAYLVLIDLPAWAIE